MGQFKPLIVGDPAFDSKVHPDLPRLPGARIEALAIGRTHGEPPLTDLQASERAVRDGLAETNLVHLAAHGKLDSLAPSASSIVLAGQDELTVADLIGLHLKADLAVLSACDSGRGAATLGGDVIGLVRGLIAAGVKQSVVSLWPVDDVAACVTMDFFHQRLRHEAPARALAGAQSDVRKLSGVDLVAHYEQLGGTVVPGMVSVRRSGVSGAANAPDAHEIPFNPEYEDVLKSPDPMEALDGCIPRIWAPFVLIG